MDLKCFICHKDLDSIDNACSHMRLIHGLFDGQLLSLECCLPSCKKKLNSYKNFREHLRSNHDSFRSKDIPLPSGSRENATDLLNIESITISQPVDDNLTHVTENVSQVGAKNHADNCGVMHSQLDVNSSIKKELDAYGKFVMNLEAANLTKTNINNIVDGSFTVVEQIFKDVTAICSDASPDIVEKLGNYVNEKRKSMESVKTTYKRNKLAVNQIGIVMPKFVPIGTREDQICDKKQVYTELFQ